MSLTIAGRPVTKPQVTGTLKMLRAYRDFLASDCGRCLDLEGRVWGRDALTKDQARHRLRFLINCAINRKAGISDHAWDYELWRDCQLVQHLVHRNNPSGLQWRWTNMRRFRTNYIQKRYGHLLRETED